MTTISIWIIGILLSVISLLLTRLLIKFDELIKNQNKVSEILVAHTTRLDNVDHRFAAIESRLENHGQRVREMELSHAACSKKD